MRQAKKISADVVSAETILYTKNGKPVVISKQPFKKSFIEERLQAFQDKIDIWNNMDLEAYRAKQLEEPLREIERLTKMKQAVDGEIGATVVIEEDE